ncbi:DUF2169 domain-containing protein [Burkholderia sp. FERM BP-3421]|uniref:DUF2169 family type VI secretion system accessory protein n=1 Tax=Burkholderia sp. FERM BP-3421 TaxID=1494466 RepID=UPI0023601FC6|nr:pentapeptide repeat-containing protein [Burkholderia sp. FERM BP-3421]WDD91933.1 DUF2169 domain-containing protein [Burkholderia sp. FERM BP-3421]
MKIIKPCRMSLLTRAYRRLGGEHFGIAALVGATLEEIPRLLTEQELWGLVADELRGDTLDMALPKPHPEFLVSGYAYGKHAATPGGGVCDVEVGIAGLHKRLRVCGERPDGPTGAPRPFERLALDWTYACGGADHADNPLGHGAVPPADSASVPPVIVYPPEPGRDAEARPVPAGFRPLDAAWPARARLSGEYDRQWLEHDCPGFPRTLDPRYFNIAPADQQLPGASAFPDGASYELRHLHPDHALIAGRLPALRARAFVVRAGDEAPEAVPMRLTTVWFIPHRARAVLIYHGVAPLREYDASDLDALLLGAEDSGHARPDDWYRQVIAWRTRHEKAALYALRDQDLLPARYLDVDAPEMGPPGVRQARARAQLSAFPNATVETPPRADQLLEFVERHEAEAAARRAELARMLEDAPPDDGASTSAHAQSGPPRATRADPALRGSHAQDGLRKLYLHAAHHQVAPPRLSAVESGAQRARVAAALADGGSLDGVDLTGVHLAGMNLRGARLAGALLENADLSDADLTGATLGRAVLVRANLARARLADADLRGANLSLARCEQTDFSGADLSECVVERVRFQDCALPGARLADTRFQSCAFLRVDFSRAHLSNLVFIEQPFDTVDFSEATISKLLLMQCPLTVLRFSGAQIDGLGVSGARGPGPLHFDRARVSHACFVESSGLAGVDFSAAIVRESNFRGADLQAADFSDAWLDDCDFTGARLPRARLRGAKIDGGGFARADLAGADLRDADLLGGFLRGARLDRADLRRANLFRANLAQILTDADTRWDDAYLVDAMRFPRAEPRA